MWACKSTLGGKVGCCFGWGADGVSCWIGGCIRLVLDTFAACQMKVGFLAAASTEKALFQDSQRPQIVFGDCCAFTFYTHSSDTHTRGNAHANLTSANGKNCAPGHLALSFVACDAHTHIYIHALGYIHACRQPRLLLCNLLLLLYPAAR